MTRAVVFVNARIPAQIPAFCIRPLVKVLVLMIDQGQKPFRVRPVFLQKRDALALGLPFVLPHADDFFDAAAFHIYVSLLPL